MDDAGILRGLVFNFRGVSAFLLASGVFKCYSFYIVGFGGQKPWLGNLEGPEACVAAWVR